MADMKWIPVTERLPRSGAFVIVCADGIVGEGIRIEDDSWYWIGCEECSTEINVTHWMPLPEPPKEVE